MGTLAERSAHNTMAIAFCDGEVANAGVGLVCQATHRLTTENTVICFRETEQGLFPAASAIYAMKDLKGRGPAIGLYLCLTGATLDGIDAVRFGIGTHLMKA